MFELGNYFIAIEAVFKESLLIFSFVFLALVFLTPNRIRWRLFFILFPIVFCVDYATRRDDFGKVELNDVVKIRYYPGVGEEFDLNLRDSFLWNQGVDSCGFEDSIFYFISMKDFMMINVCNGHHEFVYSSSQLKQVLEAKGIEPELEDVESFVNGWFFSYRKRLFTSCD